MSPTDPAETLAELRAATRDANAAIKDARAAKRELTDAVEAFHKDAHAWRQELEDTYQATMAEAVTDGLDELMAVVKDAEKRLNTRMDTVMMAITKPYQTNRGPLRLDQILTRRADGEDVRL